MKTSIATLPFIALLLFILFGFTSCSGRKHPSENAKLAKIINSEWIVIDESKVEVKTVEIKGKNYLATKASNRFWVLCPEQ